MSRHPCKGDVASWGAADTWVGARLTCDAPLCLKSCLYPTSILQRLWAEFVYLPVISIFVLIMVTSSRFSGLYGCPSERNYLFTIPPPGWPLQHRT